MIPFFLVVPLAIFVSLNTVLKHISPYSHHHVAFTTILCLAIAPSYFNLITYRIINPYSDPYIYEEVTTNVTYITISLLYSICYCSTKPSMQSIVLYTVISLHELFLGYENTVIHRLVLIFSAIGCIKHLIAVLQIKQPSAADHIWRLATWGGWFCCICTLLVDFQTRSHTAANFMLLIILPWLVPLDDTIQIKHIDYGKTPLLIHPDVSNLYIKSIQNMENKTLKEEETEDLLIFTE